MPDFCTCGAELPVDARFCHRCGKPQRAEDLLRDEAVETAFVREPAPVKPPAAVPAPGFQNPIALRVALLAASLATLLFLLIQYGFVVWLVGAGFLAAYLFSRRTQQVLSVRSGAYLGWITGILNFALLAVLFAVSAALSGDQLAQLYQEQLRQMPATDPKVAEAVKMLETPGGMAAVFLTSFAFLFAVVTAFCTAGGALGAKILHKD